MEEYYSAITQAAKRSFCGRSGYSVLEYGFQLDSFACVCICVYMYIYSRS